MGIHRSHRRDRILLYMPRLGSVVAWTKMIVKDMVRYKNILETEVYFGDIFVELVGGLNEKKEKKNKKK